MHGIIYMATNKINGNIYIGQSICSLHRRITNHYTDSKRKNYAFAKALRKYKRSDWDWEILVEINKPEEHIKKHLDFLEKRFIYMYDSYNTGYNSTVGGDWLPDNKGKNNYFYGKKLPRVTKDKISAANKGRKLNKKQRDRIGNGHAKKWKVTAPNGECVVIKNLSKYCRQNAIDAGHMCRVSQGKLNHHKNYTVIKIGDEPCR